jgi:hypothetical protein
MMASAMPSARPRIARTFSSSSMLCGSGARISISLAAATGSVASSATVQKCPRTSRVERRIAATIFRFSTSITGPASARRLNAISPGITTSSRPTTTISEISASAPIRRLQGRVRSTRLIETPSSFSPLRLPSRRSTSSL